MIIFRDLAFHLSNAIICLKLNKLLLIACPIVLALFCWISSTTGDHGSAQSKDYIRQCYSTGPNSPEYHSPRLMQCTFYVVMIDAGSTGTRMHVLKFGRSTEEQGSAYKVLHETFKEVKPGLSSFENDLDKIPVNLGTLLSMANETVPEAYWEFTPLRLQATGGLRLLSRDSVQAILQKVRDLFHDQSRFVIQPDAVGVMSGIDEGIYAWFTLNYLLGRLFDLPSVETKPETAVALDLGGASTQITFKPNQPETWKSAPLDFTQRISLNENISMKLYSHSYLGVGLIEARLKTLLLTNLTNSASNDANHIVSGCFPENYEYTWTHTKEIGIRGSPDYSFESCSTDVQRLIEGTKIHIPNELKDRELYGFSYFYERVAQAHLIDGFGGLVSIEEIHSGATKACKHGISQLGPEHWLKWQCLDLTFIHGLLTQGYGLPPTKHIHIAKKLAGHKEVSWALGASYNVLVRQLAAYRTTPVSLPRRITKYVVSMGSDLYELLVPLLKFLRI